MLYESIESQSTWVLIYLFKLFICCPGTTFLWAIGGKIKIISELKHKVKLATDTKVVSLNVSARNLNTINVANLIEA